MQDYKNENKNASKKRNLGIQVLRMFLCFRIVLLHYYSSKNIFIKKLKKRRFQVPCFFFISFYFLYPTISQKNKNKFLLRLERLLVPYIIHPIINWIINNLMFLIIKFNRYNGFLKLKDLTTQIIVGRGIYGIAVLWFHFNLLIFTIFFFIFSFILSNHFLNFFQIFALASYTLQYSGINYRFFKQYTENIWMSIGNLIETFPVAIFAFYFSSIQLNKILLNNRKKCLLFSFLFLYLLSKFDIYAKIKGFSSPGIKQIFISLFLFIFFSLIPFEIFNSKVLLLIEQLTKYTQGIYCLHFLFQYYLRLKFEKRGSFFGCILLYIISYLVSFIGFSVFSGTKLKFLFA